MVADSQPGHIDQIKHTNAGAVYRLIDQLGPVSRIDLSRLAQLAPASITKIVREMLEAHLVQETEIQEPGSRGRPAVGLVVETEAWHYLSLRISRGEIFLALRDLSSKLVVEDRLELPLNAEQPLLDAILTHIDQFFIRHQQRLERLTAIAITLPGIIDTENGIVHRMPFYENVKEMPLGDVLENHTGVPAYIQHDISAWTMAEALFGASRGARDVIQVVIDHNVGAGVITDGRLLHAGSSSLVEIGHTQVDPYGKRCYCGNHGCLETIASVESVLELAQIKGKSRGVAWRCWCGQGRGAALKRIDNDVVQLRLAAAVAIDGTLHDVFQLADIARPVVREQRLPCIIAEAGEQRQSKLAAHLNRKLVC